MSDTPQSSPSAAVAAIFVYGTLQRGQINHALLAPFAHTIEDATVQGRLHDLGDFPALLPGDGTVYGELIRLDPDDLPRVLPVIDRLEGYREEAPEQSIYRRCLTAVTLPDGRRERAYTYLYTGENAGLPAPQLLPYLPGGRWPPEAPGTSPVAGDDLERYRRWVHTHAGSEEDSPD